MIQRKQTLWLFIASLLSVTLLLNWYTGWVYKADMAQGFGMVVQKLTVLQHYPSLILAVMMIALPVVAVFRYKDRKQQRGLSLFSILASISFIGVNLMRINHFNETTAPAPQNGSYQAGMVVPVFVILFLILAIRGISRDEKLVKSMDRLR